MSGFSRNKFSRAVLVRLEKIFILLFILTLLQGCQGEPGRKLTVEIPMETQAGGKPYLKLSEETKSRVFMLNGFYEMENFIPDLAFEKNLSVAEKTYIVTSLFSQGSFAREHMQDKKIYEYYLEVYDAEHNLVKLNYIHRDAEKDWSTVLDQKFSYLNQEGYCVLTFTEPESGMDCVVRGTYSVLCRAGESTEQEKPNQAIAITTTKLLVGNRKYLEGAKVLTGPDGEEYLITVRVVDWNLDGCFDRKDRVLFPFLDANEFYPLGEKIKLPAEDLLPSLTRKEVGAKQYDITLSHSSSQGYVLKISSKSSGG